MKLTSTLTAAALLLTPVVTQAAPWDIFRSRPAPQPPRHEEHGRPRYDNNDRRGEYRGPDRDRDRGRGERRDGGDGRVSRLEFKAQLRLRELGFYRGPVDGDFGRGSRAALYRFQKSRGLRPSGELTGTTIRALRI